MHLGHRYRGGVPILTSCAYGALRFTLLHSASLVSGFLPAATCVSATTRARRARSRCRRTASSSRGVDAAVLPSASSFYRTAQVMLNQ